MTFTSDLLVERTDVGGRQSVKEQGKWVWWIDCYGVCVQVSGGWVGGGLREWVWWVRGVGVAGEGSGCGGWGSEWWVGEWVWWEGE